VNRRPRLTVRARLTLLYTGLFAVCGAIVVAVSYILVAQLAATGQRTYAGAPAAFAARCRSESLLANPDKSVLAKCNAYLEHVGAQHQRDLILSHLLAYSLITLGVVLALSALLGWILSGRALRPVHLITAAARAASERNLSARVALRGPRDELRELADTFDEMLGRLEAAFEGQRQFIANASHELRTPLAVMRTTVDVVAGNPDSTPAELRDMATDIRAAVDQAERLIGALFILARNERGLTVREPVDLATVAEDVLDTVDPGDLHVHATLHPAVISGDPVLVERLAANLVDNARRYNVRSGDLWVTTRTEGGRCVLRVANTGPQVSPSDAERILQPFQRLSHRTGHEGFGLGLTIAASIAGIHGGAVSAVPRADGGLTVTVVISSAAPVAGAHRAAPRSVTGPPDGASPSQGADALREASTPA
jgi:signal transduction histidine kinase